MAGTAPRVDAFVAQPLVRLLPARGARNGSASSSFTGGLGAAGAPHGGIVCRRRPAGAARRRVSPTAASADSPEMPSRPPRRSVEAASGIPNTSPSAVTEEASAAAAAGIAADCASAAVEATAPPPESANRVLFTRLLPRLRRPSLPPPAGTAAAAARSAAVARQAAAGWTFHPHPGLGNLPMLTTAPTPAIEWIVWAVKAGLLYIRVAGNGVEAAVRTRAVAAGAGGGGARGGGEGLRLLIARARGWAAVAGLAIQAVATGGGRAALRKAIEPVEAAADESAAALDASAVPNTAKSSADPYDPYRALFTTLPVPPMAATSAIESDAVFARLRVAGPNPMVLARVVGRDGSTNVERGSGARNGVAGASGADATRGGGRWVGAWLTDAHLRAVAGCKEDTVEEAISDHRLYVADYRPFATALRDAAARDAARNDGVRDNPAMEGGADGRGVEVLAAPVAVFVLPPPLSQRTAAGRHYEQPSSSSANGRLIPVAILPDDAPGVAVVTPSDGVAWAAAKAIVNAADGAHHELDSHLARTHLFVNLPLGVTARRLSAAHHPLWRLLMPHGDGTPFINNLTPHTLLKPSGDVHLLLPTSRESQVAYVGGVVTGARFNDRFPRNELAARGLLDEAALHYPYREDVLAHYDALEEFVAAVLGEYYTCDADVADDEELAAWAADMSAPSPDGAGLRGFGEPLPDGTIAEGTIQSVGYLVSAVTLLIWTASAQHAAVNFPQADLMASAAAFPLAVRSGAPRLGSAMSITQWLPPLRVAARQLFLGAFLGGLVHLPLGTYPLTPLPGGWFRSSQGARAVAKLRTRLAAIDARIVVREAAEEVYKYEYLRPARVPRSINI
ncbi:hypothetical protein MMPV_007824 [Pyropia vietnamensis]